MGRLIYEPLASNELEKIIKIENESFVTPWTKTMYRNELPRKHSFLYTLKAEISDKSLPVVAFICFHVFSDEMHILKIAVSPRFRKHGLGSRLLKNSIREAVKSGASKAFLEVRNSNKAAISLYLKAGFTIVGKRPNYYTESREDALVMIKNLKELQ